MKHELTTGYEDHDLNPDYSKREIAIQLNHIANELVESNRLKKLELLMIETKYSVSRETIVGKVE